MKPQSKPNLDPTTIESFGSEWSKFDQSALSEEELHALFAAYFDIFPWQTLPANAEGFDMGCGSGRWAKLVAPRVGRLNCVDPSSEALEVARKTMNGLQNVCFLNAPADGTTLPEGSQDFGYSLGVLHHIPDTASGLKACTRLLKPGAPFLLYLYYRFDNRPAWFRLLWSGSDVLRSAVSRLPERAKFAVTDALAGLLYWPLSRLALLAEKFGGDPRHLPLAFYRRSSFYTMRTDSRDRFGTPLELRFTRLEIAEMMHAAGLEDVRFSEREPYWVAVGVKRA
jgi:SAM-dependent methyltransferase